MNEFELWSDLKQKLNCRKRLLFFHEREIWYTHIGKNIGFEQDGTGNTFTRPVLIFKKINYDLFFGIPLTTTVKDSKHYFEFTFKSRPNCLILSQLRTVDQRRLIRKIGYLDEKVFVELKVKLFKYIF